MSSSAPNKWSEVLENALKQRGLRLTVQRFAIAKTFFEAEGHLNADELCSAVRVDYPAIGQATVYRTLKLLEEVGLASSSTFGSNSARFEVNDGHHHDHLVCIACDRIVEFLNEDIEALQEHVAKEHGFTLTSHRMELFGLCRQCRALGRGPSS